MTATSSRLVVGAGCLLLAISSAIAAGGSAAAAAATGGIGIRLLDAPASAGADPRARLYIVDRVAPGTVIQRRVEVSNTTTSIAHVVLYEDAATIENGSFVGAAGHTTDALTSWTTVSPATSDLAAGRTAIVSVAIRVPPDATAGERYGVIWAEVRGTSAADAVTEVSRVGVRIYLSVGSGGSPPADFKIESFAATRSTFGQPMVIANVRNTGGRALDITGVLQLLAGPGGLSAGPYPVNLGVTLAIGDLQPVTTLLDGQLPNGPWNARLTLRSGLLEHSSEATITFPSSGSSSAVGRPVPPVHDSSWLRGAVGGALGMLAALMAGAAVALLVRRKRRSVGSLQA